MYSDYKKYLHTILFKSKYIIFHIIQSLFFHANMKISYHANEINKIR